MKKIFLYLLTGVLLCWHQIALANNLDFQAPASESFYPNIARPSTASSDGAGATIAGIISYGIGITAILSVIAITWAGIAMFLSVGEEQKYNNAKDIMIYALIGAGLSAGAYLIVTVVSRLNFS